MILVCEKVKICNPMDSFRLLRKQLLSEDVVEQDKEHFWAFGLDGSHTIKYLDLVTLGIVDQTLVHPREVFCRAIRRRCSALIVAHNHPSNQLEPSKDDIALTQQLRVAGDIIGISVLDHVIVTKCGYYSFAEKGTL